MGGPAGGGGTVGWDTWTNTDAALGGGEIGKRRCGQQWVTSVSG